MRKEMAELKFPGPASVAAAMAMEYLTYGSSPRSSTVYLHKGQQQGEGL